MPDLLEILDIYDVFLPDCDCMLCEQQLNHWNLTCRERSAEGAAVCSMLMCAGIGTCITMGCITMQPGDPAGGGASP